MKVHIAMSTRNREMWPSQGVFMRIAQNLQELLCEEERKEAYCKQREEEVQE